MLLWETDPNKKGRVVAKVRVTDLEDIPKSIRFTEGNMPDAESWTFLVEVLQQNLLGGVHLMRTHFQEMEWTHIPCPITWLHLLPPCPSPAC
jgi:hypothetical protein